MACSFKFRIVYKAKAITDIFCKNGHNECECNIIYYNVALSVVRRRKNGEVPYHLPIRSSPQRGQIPYHIQKEVFMSTTQPIRNTEKLKLFKEYFKYEKPNIRNYTLIIIGLNSALRISDILPLTYGDIYDFENKEWKTHIVLTERKTGKLNRIYINEEIRKVLEEQNCSFRNAKDWIFCSRIHKEQPLSRYQAFRLIKEAASYAGLEADISCHSLRKTFGYHAWKQGTPPALLMNIYNHSSYQITRRYLGIDQNDKDEVFEKIRL